MSSLKELLDTDADFRDLMSRKSEAILAADTLEGSGDLPAAIRAYRRAAQLEYCVFEYLQAEGPRESALRSIVSSATCWLEAEEYPSARKATRKALELCGEDDAATRRLCLELLRKAEGQPPQSEAPTSSVPLK